MKLSDALNLFYVMPLNHSVLVGFTINEDAEDNDVNPITITWDDPNTNTDYLQVFDDQEILPLQGVEGGFWVHDAEDQAVGFIALEPAAKDHLA